MEDARKGPLLSPSVEEGALLNRSAGDQPGDPQPYETPPGSDGSGQVVLDGAEHVTGGSGRAPFSGSRQRAGESGVGGQRAGGSGGGGQRAGGSGGLALGSGTERNAPRAEPDGETSYPGVEPVSRVMLAGYVLVAIFLVGWFLWGWLGLRQGFIDSVGESAGAGFALLLLVSIIGTLRRSRR